MASSHDGTCPRDLLQGLVAWSSPLVCADLKGALSRYFRVILQCRNMFLHQWKPKNNDAETI